MTSRRSRTTSAATTRSIGELEDKGKTELADRLRAIGRDWRATIVYQDQPKGLGHAVGCAREAVGDEPFAVMLPDELMGSSALLAQMNGVCASTGGSVVAVVNVPREQVSSYGVIDPAGELSADGVIPVRDLVEKPSVDDAPSNFVITGRYVLTADAWQEIADLRPGRGGELQLTDALRAQAARSPFHAVVSSEGRHDTGTPARLPHVVDRTRAAAPRVRRPPQGVPRLAPALTVGVAPADRDVGRSVAAEAVGEIGDETELVDVEVDRHARLVDVLPTAHRRSGSRCARRERRPASPRRRWRP